MHVLHQLGTLNPSGMETMLRCSGGLWRRAGMDCRILAMGASLGPYSSCLKEAGYPIDHLPMRRSRLHLPTLFRYLVEARPDVLHLHCEGQRMESAICARLARVPRVVATVHNDFGAVYRGTLRWRKTRERRLARYLGVRFVAVSESVRRTEMEAFRNPCEVVDNWCDIERLQPPSAAERNRMREKAGLPPDTLAVVTVGNCNDAKNHGMLLDALGRLTGGLRWAFLHVGEGPDTEHERRKASDLGIEEKVRFLGSRSDVPDILKASDIFVMSSRREGFPVAGVEAGAVGLPLVLTRAPGLQDLALRLPGSLVVDLTAEGVADGIDRLMKMPEDARRALGMKNVEGAASFSPAHGVEAYRRIYSNASGTEQM